MKQKLKKIVISGTSGCGKTTLGKKLASKLGVKCIDLDDLFWLPNWEKRPDEEFIKLLHEELNDEAWIICGNNSYVRKAVWHQADVVVWLDFPRHVCMWRAWKRSMRAWWKKEPFCNGNYETLERFFSRESILIWIWKSYARRKNALLESQAIRLRSNDEIQNFIQEV